VEGERLGCAGIIFRENVAGPIVASGWSQSRRSAGNTADHWIAMISNARCVDSGSEGRVPRVPTASESMAWCVDPF
jgi:hypothetical protein